MKGNFDIKSRFAIPSVVRAPTPFPEYTLLSPVQSQQAAASYLTLVLCFSKARTTRCKRCDPPSCR